MALITHHEVTYSSGKRIHYLASGPIDGPLILFIHGWPATAITWKAQIDAAASVGFRAIAPDMPGYGNSTAHRVADDYCQEALVEGMMALLSDTGYKSGIWVGHDWGSAVTSSVAIHYPEAVKALVSVCVPYLTIELGWDGFLPLVNRKVYPSNQYEYGQWDYMKHYEENFEHAVQWFEHDITGFCRVLARKPMLRPNPDVPYWSANVRKTGWTGGALEPSKFHGQESTTLAPDVLESFMINMQKTGFWPGSAYYLNHERNSEYNSNMKQHLTQPALFIHARWDMVCDTKTSKLLQPMREACSNLTEVTIDAGHFVSWEKPEDFNAALFRFILDALPSEWPRSMDCEYTRS